MKNILNLIFTIVVTVGFSTTSFARNPAAGDDPNAEMSSLSEAGTFVEGTNFKGQKPVCKACQNRNNVLLPQAKDNYQPGMAPSGTKDTPADGQSNK